MAGLTLEHAAICFENACCGKCGHEQIMFHPFLERLICGKCKSHMRSLVPRRPDPGEPTALDYEEALNKLAKKDLSTALYVRDYATSLACERV